LKELPVFYEWTEGVWVRLMEQFASKAVAGRRIEMIVRRLDSLATFPAVITQLLSQISSPEIVVQIVESDPALSIKVLSLARTQGVRFTEGRPSVREAVFALPLEIMREAALSMKVFEIDNYEIERQRILSHKQLALHSLAVACCTRSIAEFSLPASDRQLAFSAGLLHDIGKLALAEVMPKSFERIVNEAKAQNLCSSAVEQKYLSFDHTVIGKHLAEKWHLPAEVVFAIWLHHSDTETISKSLPLCKMAVFVYLADLIAHEAKIGESGSYDFTGEAISRTAEFLSLSSEQIRQIREKLDEEVEQKSRVLGLDAHDFFASYCNTIRDKSIQLSGDNRKLSMDNRKLMSDLAHLNLVTDFLASVEPQMTTNEFIEKFAVRWQKFYQTGPVCIYLLGSKQKQFLEAVVVDESGLAESFMLKLPANFSAIPAQLRENFAILDASEYVGWLFEQIEVPFNSGKTKIAPLLKEGRAIGVIIFEQRYPIALESRLAGFSTVASVGAAVISLGLLCEQQTRLSEKFAEFLGRVRQERWAAIESESLTGLAEMAAGAAHELNNPLAIISGRVQLLAKNETDPEKKRILSQIQDKTKEISEIIVDLANYARPSPPAPTTSSVRELLKQAIVQTAREYKTESLEVKVKNLNKLGDVFVDSRQVVSAFAKIFSNALDSYPGGRGPIRIVGACDESGDFVRLQITDLGCGMSDEVLKKAAKPFFSEKPAGRKRGMGLAYAYRVLQLNKGSLRLASRQGDGTTVTVLLPRR
jgi:putative nucleotidyltransferase with HDIG domain